MKNIIDQLDEWTNEKFPDSEILIPNGFEEAFIGVATQFNKLIPIFDRAKCINILIDQGMSPEDAEEFFQFNVEGAWHGEGTPAFIEFFNQNYDVP